MCLHSWPYLYSPQTHKLKWEKGRDGLDGNMCDLEVCWNSQVFSSVSSKLIILWDRTAWLTKGHLQTSWDRWVHEFKSYSASQDQLYSENMFIIPFLTCSSEKWRGSNSTEKHNSIFWNGHGFVFESCNIYVIYKVLIYFLKSCQTWLTDVMDTTVVKQKSSEVLFSQMPSPYWQLSFKRELILWQCTM